MGLSNSATNPVLIGYNGGSVGNFQIIENWFVGSSPDNVITSYELSSITCTKNLIAGNWSGTAIAALGASCIISNNTIANGAHGISAIGANSVVVNNIVFGMQVYAISNPHATSIVDYNNFWGSADNSGSGPNGMSVDPQFKDQESDFHLWITSPCINAGDPNSLFNDPDGSRNDIGCFFRRTVGKQLIVPVDYFTIQSALYAAIDDDTVLVLPGNYAENLSMLWKRVLLLGRGGADSVLLTPLDQQVSIFRNEPYCESPFGCTGGRFVIRGFTFANCTGAAGRHFMLSDDRSGSVEDCRFESNK